MPIDLPHYYDRFDPTANFERHLFRAGNVLQSAELNELQSASMHRLQRITDALMKEGDVLSGADIQINPTTGATTIAGGALYLKGTVRGVPAGSLTLPVTGTVMVGVYLTTVVVTELDDPDLRDPAVSFRNFQDPGAARLRIDATWGYAGDNQLGDFYPVYRVEEGYLIGQTPPPQVDAIAQVVARYDRQSAGGYYVSAGMTVSRLEDTAWGHQVYSIAAGVARVDGEEIVRQNDRRVIFTATPDVRNIDNEPHLASGGTETLACDFVPMFAIEDVSVLRQETTTLTHGVSGSLDIIYAPDGVTQRTAVVNIVSCSQGATTYIKGTDYQLTAGKVDWSLSPTAPEGEPGVGNTYTCVFQYRDTYVPAPEDYDKQQVTVTGAVPGSEIMLSYAWALPRYDLICLNNQGELRFVIGVSATLYPRLPAVPQGLLGLAVLAQWWDGRSRVINNSTRMVPMNELNRISANIDTLFALVAEERLALNLSQRDLPAKKGVFADPFLNDNLRDQGLTQTAAIVQGTLTLGVEATVYDQHLDTHATLIPGSPVLVINQFLRTGSMNVNPYDSFQPLPSSASLVPAIDQWSTTAEQWLSPITRVFQEPADKTQLGFMAHLDDFRLPYYATATTKTWNTTSTATEGSASRPAEFLRSIPVEFTLSRFGPGETLEKIYFDGVAVPFEEVV